MLSIENIKDVIFDFDGVIIDSEKKKFKNIQNILKDYNFNLNDSEYHNFIGKKRAKFLEEIGVSNIEEIMSKIHAKDSDDFILIEDLLSFIEFLHKNKIKMHIATGSLRKFVEQLLIKHNIKKYFSEIITGDEIDESKPNPKIYIEMKKRISSNHIVVIEDSPVGVKAAKDAELFVIGLGINLNANIECSSYKDLLKLFQQTHRVLK